MPVAGQFLIWRKQEVEFARALSLSVFLCYRVFVHQFPCCFTISIFKDCFNDSAFNRFHKQVNLLPLCGIPEAKLIRLRNPHGNSSEWKGAWSDR